MRVESQFYSCLRDNHWILVYGTSYQLCTKICKVFGVKICLCARHGSIWQSGGIAPLILVEGELTASWRRCCSVGGRTPSTQMTVLRSWVINRTGPGISSGKFLLWIVLSQALFPWHFFRWTNGGVHRSCFSFQTSVPSLLRIMFLVLLSFVSNILTISMAWFLDFSLNLLLLF